MRHALIGTAALVALACASYACGSDSDTDNGSSTSSSSSGKPNPSSSSSTSSTSSSSSSSSSTSSSSSSTSSGGTSNGGPVIADSGTIELDSSTAIPDGGGPVDASDPGFDGAAGTQCQLASLQEVEPNDTEANANVIPGKTGSFCGRLFPSGTDTDVVKFTLPTDASEMTIGVNQVGPNFRLEGKVGTDTFVLAGQDAGGSFPFKPGQDYFLTATGNGQSDYIIGLTVKQVTSSKCATGSIKEAAEPNDTTAADLGQATSSFCGTINTTADLDLATFTIPDGQNFMKIGFESTGPTGSFSIEGKVEGGQTFHIPKKAGDPDQIPFVRNKPYTLTLSSTAPNNSYVVNVQLSPTQIP